MESALSKIDTTVLDNIIVGRVEPYIYTPFQQRLFLTI